MSWLGIERQTGFISGMWTEKKLAIESCENLAKRWRGSSWSIAEIDLSMDELRERQKNCYGDYSRFLIHHQDNQHMLNACFGNTDTGVKKQNKHDDGKFSIRCGNEIAATLHFNEKFNAFDVLTDYAFGGDKQSALEYLKTL
jgi:hypothetical protein